MELPKVKAIEIELSDGQKILVHEPKAKDLTIFLKSLPALTALGKIFEASQQAADGVLGMSPNLPDNVLDGIFPLLAAMADISVEQFRELGSADALAIMQGLSLFAPKNPQAAS